ncbi:MAG: hypothetical protein KAR47_13010 [Planctomycetes bacterium]|nr:hypothetical protein [Planctomycetota bacterium]
MAKKSGSRTVVGSALSPAMLLKMGVLGKIPPPDKDFRPDGTWGNSYRICTCHGYLHEDNDNPGLLQIRRVASKGKGGFSLSVFQKIVHQDAAVVLSKAEMSCATDRSATLRSWKMSSRFLDHDEKIVGELTDEQDGRVKGGAIRIKTSSGTFDRKTGGPVTSDWDMFEAVQRMEFDVSRPVRFNLLEGLTLNKGEQKLRYRGIYTFKSGDGRQTLHWFTQIGHGVLPYDYYLDRYHRLVLVITGPRSYILDDNAEDIVDTHRKEKLRQYRQKLEKMTGGKRS